MMKKRGLALVLALILCAACVLTGCGGSSGKDAVQARCAKLYDADFLQDYLDEPQEYEQDIASFGVSDFAKTFADSRRFRCYNAEIAVSNAGDIAVNCLALEVPDGNEGKGGVYIGTLGDGVSVGLPAHFEGEQEMYYPVIADASLSEEEVFAALNDMKVAMVFVDSATGADFVEEAKPEDLQQSTIHFGA